MSETTEIFINNNYDSSQIKETVVTSVKRSKRKSPLLPTNQLVIGPVYELEPISVMLG